jgi:anti-sigma regulatory factor (Ser/Thr protein kinase)
VFTRGLLGHRLITAANRLPGVSVRGLFASGLFARMLMIATEPLPAGPGHPGWVLPFCPTGAAAARRLVTAKLGGWRLDALADPVRLVVSELVTNALRYGQPPCVLRLIRRDRRLEAAVFDAGPPFDPRRPGPAACREDPGEPGGWGLAAIVTGYADSWLVVPVDGGKAVIASWQVPGPVARPPSGAAPAAPGRGTRPGARAVDLAARAPD